MLQVPPRDVFHHQIMMSALTEVIDYLRNAGMRQASEHARFAMEVLDGLTLLGAVTEYHFLGGDRPIRQPGIIGEIHAPHSASPQQFVDTIAAVEQMTNGKRLAGFHNGRIRCGTRRAETATGAVLRAPAVETVKRSD